MHPQSYCKGKNQRTRKKCGKIKKILLSSVQSHTCVQLFVTVWTAARQASLSITISWRWLKLMSIESVMPSNHIILCHPLLLLPLVFPSIRVFPMSQLFASGSHIFSFIISLSNEYSELISFRTDWFDLLAIQGTLKSLPSICFSHLPLGSLPPLSSRRFLLPSL